MSSIHPHPDDELVEQAVVWSVRIASSGLTSEEKSQLRRWLATSPRHAAALDLVTQASDGAAQIEARRLRHQAATKVRGSRRRWRIAAAMTSAACAVLAIQWALVGQTQSVVASSEQRRAVVLADGTHLLVDKGGRVEVRMTGLARNARVVRGRAEFAVAKEPHRSFVVSTDRIRVTALGTRFVVAEGASDYVVLEEGRIKVADLARAITLHVRPGQKAVLENDQLAIKSADIEAEIGWRDGRLILRDVSLAAALLSFCRETGAKVTLGNPDLATIRVSGTFDADDVEGFIEALAELHALQWRQTGDRTFAIDERPTPRG